MKLVSDKSRYEKFPLTAGVLMDVMKAVAAIKRSPRKTIRVSVKKHYTFIKNGMVGVKTKRKQHPKGWKLQQKPILIARVFGIDCVFDGWHRILDAHRKGKKYIRAYRLTAIEGLECACRAEEFKRK